MNRLDYVPKTSLGQDPLFKRVLIAVLLVHALFFLFAWLKPEFSRVKPALKSVVVKTVKLNPAPALATASATKKSPSSAVATPAPAKAAVKPVPKESPKETPKAAKQQVKEPVKPAAKAPSKPATPSAPSEKNTVTSPEKMSLSTNKALIAEAQKALADISSTPIKSVSKTQSEVTAPLLTLFSLDSKENTQGELSAIELGYCEELIMHMRLSLRLPTHGDVKLRLTLKKNGSVVKMEILSSASLENKNYIEKMLSQMQFPSFGQNFPGEDQHAFLVTLTNE